MSIARSSLSHRADQGLRVLQRGDQFRVVAALRVEVGPDAEDDPGAASRTADGTEQLDEPGPLPLVTAEGEHLLELVHQQQDLCERRPADERLADRQVEVGGVRLQVGAAAPVAMPSRAPSWMASSSNGCSPGVSRMVDHSWLPGSFPARIAGSSPARNSDDLPLPDAPKTARNRCLASRLTKSLTSRSRPKEALGVGRLERGQAKVRRWAVPGPDAAGSVHVPGT